MGLTEVRDTDLRDKIRGLSPGNSVPGARSTARAVKAEHSALKEAQQSLAGHGVPQAPTCEDSRLWRVERMQDSGDSSAENVTRGAED